MACGGKGGTAKPSGSSECILSFRCTGPFALETLREPAPMDEGIENVAAGHAAPSRDPRPPERLLQIEKVILDHQSPTPVACHVVPPSAAGMGSAPPLRDAATNVPEDRRLGRERHSV